MIIESDNIQCMFRINGMNTNKLYLELFNGQSNHTYLSQQHILLNRINYTRDKKNVIQDITNCHYLDKKWIEMVINVFNN